MDRTKILLETVQSILRQTVLPDELILVDASKHDKNVQSKLQSVVQDKIPTKYLHTNPSTSMQRNLGAEASSCDIVLFMDDDVILEEDHIEHILKFYNERKPLSFSGVRGNSVKYSNKQNRFYNLLKRLFLLQEMREWAPAKMKRSGFARLSPVVNNVSKIEVAPAGCISFWRSVFLKHRFDTCFSGYITGEDQDLTWRISRDLPLFHIPSAKFMLIFRQSIKEKEVFLRRKNWFFMHRYFFKKNFSGKFLNNVAYYWALFGYFIMFTLVGLRAKNFIYLKAFVAGITPKIRE